jgi:protein-tyrosine kinase
MSRIEQALRNAQTDTAATAREDGRSTTLDAYPAVAPGEEPNKAGDMLVEPPIPLGESAELSDTLIVHEQAPRICSEQFRGLAAALHQKQGERGLKTVMITSAHANEGKTFTAANLGLMLSESYRRRVLIIDADLRRPSLHSVFNLSNADGLSDGLKPDMRRCVKVTEVSEWLAILPGGTPEADPMPSLTSGRLQTIIREAAAKFDWVILDTPPVALVPDGPLMGTMVDGAVLVVGAGVTPYRLVHRAVEALGRNKIIGVVLNRIDRSSLPEASYEHYGQKKMAADRRRRIFGLGYVPAKQ